MSAGSGAVRGGVAGQRVACPVLVGRSGELELLVSAVLGLPAVVVVEGEAGVGKTRLISELCSRPELAGRRIVVGSCRRIREPFPLGPLLEAVRGVGDDLARASLSPVVGALRPLLPELSGVLPPLPEPLGDWDGERHRVFRGLVEVFASLGAAVVVLEDLHWADEHTAEFIGYLLAEPPPQLSLLVTFRGEEVPARVRAAMARPSPQLSRAELVLRPLDAEQTGVLAAAVLGADRISADFGRHLCERSAGLPFVIEELLALLRSRGTLIRRGARWERRALNELDVPAGIRDPILERLGRLSEVARPMVEAAAVLANPVPPAVLAFSCRMEGGEMLRGLGEALESRLLVEHRDAVGFRHPLAAQAVYDAIPLPQRQHLHSRAVAAVRRLDPVPLGQVAHHLRQASRLDEWVEAAEEAADQAFTLGYHDEAARLLEDVLRHAHLDTDQLGRLAVKLGEASSRTLGALHGVAGLLSEVLERDLPQVVRGELHLRLAILNERNGAEFRIQRSFYARAVEHLADRPDLMAQAMAALGIPCVPGIRMSEHRKWLQRALETMPFVDDPAWRVGLLGKVAMVNVGVGDPRWRQQTTSITQEVGGTPTRPVEVGAYRSIAQNACYAGHLDTAEELLAGCLSGAAASGNAWQTFGIRATVALLDYCRGAWDGLAERADALIDRLSDHAVGRGDVEVVAGCLAVARGDLDRGSEALDELVSRLESRGAFDLLPIPTNALVRLAVARGDVAGARAKACRFIAAMESVPFEVSSVRALPALTTALVADGQPSRARALVERSARKARSLDVPLAAAAIPHARGFLASAADRCSTAVGNFCAAADQYDRLSCRYEAAQAREQAGLLLVATDGPERGRGEELLRTALVTYQGMGAVWDAARTAGFARRHGVPVASGHRGGRRGYGDRMSPRERDVASLIANGRTNKEIAAELYVSVKTVERHVSVVMRKLGVTSRRMVAGRLASRGGDVADHQ